MFRAQLGETVTESGLPDKTDQGTAIKAVIGTVIGMYLIWRFLLNRY